MDEKQKPADQGLQCFKKCMKFGKFCTECAYLGGYGK